MFSPWYHLLHDFTPVRLETRPFENDLEDREQQTKCVPESSQPSPTKQSTVSCRCRCCSCHGGSQAASVPNRGGLVACATYECMGESPLEWSSIHVVGWPFEWRCCGVAVNLVQFLETISFFQRQAPDICWWSWPKVLYPFLSTWWWRKRTM